jgi:hypothetical protein
MIDVELVFLPACRFNGLTPGCRECASTSRAGGNYTQKEMVCEKYRLQAFDMTLLPVANQFCLSIISSATSSPEKKTEKPAADYIVILIAG